MPALAGTITSLTALAQTTLTVAETALGMLDASATCFVETQEPHAGA